MATDITRLFCDLSRVYLNNYSSLKVDSTKIPVYLIGTGWLNDGLNISKKHVKPTFIRYTSPNTNVAGEAMQITIDDKWKYYMRPVDLNEDALVYEINLNEIISRDMAKGVSNTISVKFTPFTYNNTTGQITELSTSAATSVGVFKDSFTRTTVMTDLELFNISLNAIDKQVKSSSKTKVTISKNGAGMSISGIAYISQYDDVILEAPLDSYYCALSCYYTLPNEVAPDSTLIIGGQSNDNYNNDFSHKFNLAPNKSNYSVHLNDVLPYNYYDSDARDSAYTVLKYVGDSSVLYNFGTTPLTIHYYYSDDESDVNIINAFKNIRRFI